MTNESSEQTDLLREILRWLKFAGLKEVRNVLVATLDTDQKKIVYQLSDGELASLPISKAAKISDSTVRSYWQAWGKIGIMEPIKKGTGERYKKVFKLEEFGFDIPRVAFPSQETVDKASEVLST